MQNISIQLRKYFISISIISVLFIAIVSNIGINVFFSKYVKELRNKNDMNIVTYIEQLYNQNKGLDSIALMNIIHYAFSESATVRIKDMKNEIVWKSNSSGSMMSNDEDIQSSLVYRSYPLKFEDQQVGIIEIGRVQSIFAAPEDRNFVFTMNAVYTFAFMFSLIIAVFLSIQLARKFLQPIYQIKENAKLIEKARYNQLNKVQTTTIELKGLSESIKELAEKLGYQEEIRKRMTSDIAHELRTPLATLQSHIEAFMDGVWQPTQEKLGIIHHEITRLTKLIKNLSELSILENENIQLNMTKVDLSILVRNVAESFEPLFLSKDINFQKDIQERVEFTGDPDRLNQIFINLLSNAFKYTMEKGHVSITLKENRETILVIVEDSGIGIPQSDITHIFERFYRSDISRTRGTGGTGIGLTITKVLVEAHGGEIHAESEVGKGTRMVIEFTKSISNFYPKNIL